MIRRRGFAFLNLVACCLVAPECASAAILFADNFDDGDSNGWTCSRWVENVSCDPGGNCAVEGQAFVVRENPDGVWTRAGTDTRLFSDAQFDLDFMGLAGVDKHIVFLALDDCGQGQGHVLNMRGSPYNDIRFNGWNGPLYNGTGLASIPNTNGVWYHVTAVFEYPRITVSVDGMPLLDVTFNGAQFVGGLDFYSLNNSVVAHDNVIVTALPTTDVEALSWGSIKSLYR